MHSVYDEFEGRADSMTIYQACHLCHNGNKKCERPPSGGQCKRCANTYIPRSWASNGDLPSFCDNKTSDHVWALLHALPDDALSLFENPTAYHTLTISLAGSINSDACEPYKIHFLGPLRHDNTNLVQQFDQIVQRDLSAPRIKVSKDLHGLVARACLAGGYLNLFFSVDKINDGTQDPLESNALLLGIAHFILMRISNLVGDVMALASAGPMSRNARLSLSALHVIVNRIKSFTSRQAYLRPLYDNLELSRLLKDRIQATEGELRRLFQGDCGLIKDWGAPLTSSRKEFKNTSQSVDHMTLTAAITTWDDFPGQGTYPTAISTPSDSSLSPILVGSLSEIELPAKQFAGLEGTPALEPEDPWISNRTPADSEYSGKASFMEYYDSPMQDLINYDEGTSRSPKPRHSNDEDISAAYYRNGSAYHQFQTTDPTLTEWELLFNANQMPVADYQEQVLGSPIHWNSDPGTSDVALS